MNVKHTRVMHASLPPLPQTTGPLPKAHRSVLSRSQTAANKGARREQSSLGGNLFILGGVVSLAHRHRRSCRSRKRRTTLPFACRRNCNRSQSPRARRRRPDIDGYLSCRAGPSGFGASRHGWGAAVGDVGCYCRGGSRGWCGRGVVRSGHRRIFAALCPTDTP